MAPKKVKKGAKTNAKKRKASTGESSLPEGCLPDPATWPGWCEIESEPVRVSKNSQAKSIVDSIRPFSMS